MPNVYLTKPMEAFVNGLIQAGEYENVDEVVQAGVRTLMEQQNAQQFYQLKSELEIAIQDVENGNVIEFDPVAYEPDAFVKS